MLSDQHGPARRAFLIRMAGAAAATLLPVSLLEASEVCAVPGPAPVHDPCGDWTLDDVFTAYPPYTFDIRRGAAHDGMPAAGIAPVDAMWGV